MWGGRVVKRNIVNWQLGGDFSAGIGLLDMKWLGIDIYASLPMSFWMSSSIPNEISCGTEGQPACVFDNRSGFYIGDMNLAAKIRILGEKWQGIGLAIVGGLQLPTGNAAAFHGEQQLTFFANLAVSKTFAQRFRLAGNVGIRTRPSREFFGLITASEFTYGIGASVAVVPDRFDIMAEAAGGAALSNIQLSSSPLELLAGIKVYPLSQPTLALHLGGGFGILSGYGMPTFRVFVGIVWTALKRGEADRDGDGVPDVSDNCPDTPGPKENQGCPPDRDKDGIIDSRDRCPDKPGPKENQGCPYGDIDSDGIPDNDDKCPNQPGPPDNNGCPYGDRDGDGLKDNVDGCPDKPGPKANNGCPNQDRDKDTVLDKDDKCPDIPGDPNNNGCPKKQLIKVDRSSGKLILLEKVYFDTNKATIKQRSFPVLQQVLSVLKSNPKMRIRIEGHTDSRGSARSNRSLSQRRTNSVKSWLTERGIEASRLMPKGFGEARPIASNRTRRGRAKNRRVEFHIEK